MFQVFLRTIVVTEIITMVSKFLITLFNVNVDTNNKRFNGNPMKKAFS